MILAKVVVTLILSAGAIIAAVWVWAVGALLLDAVRRLR